MRYAFAHVNQDQPQAANRTYTGTHTCVQTQNTRPNVQGQTDLLRIGEDSVGLVDFFVVLVCGLSSCLAESSHLVGMAAQRSLVVCFFDLRHKVRGIDP